MEKNNEMKYYEVFQTNIFICTHVFPSRDLHNFFDFLNIHLFLSYWFGNVSQNVPWPLQ